MTTSDPIETGKVEIGDVTIPFAVDTMCDLPAVVSEATARKLKGTGNAEAKKYRIEVMRKSKEIPQGLIHVCVSRHFT